MIEMYNILKLKDGNEYVVAKMLEYNDITYALLIEIDENEDLKEKEIIVKEISINGENKLLAIKNKEEYNEIKKLFIDLLFQE